MAILQVLVFDPPGTGSEVDATLRDSVLPDLLERAGILDAYVGRHGPGENGERVIVSIWESRDDMVAEQDEGARLDILPVEIAIRVERSDPPRILRVFRGEIRPGELDAYIDDVRRGASADAEANQGLIALYLGTERPNRFVTVSAWTNWTAIEIATGGNVKRPFATRNTDRMVAGHPTHYEILPNAGRPPAHLEATALLG